jgi:hypothetical protein
MTAKNFFLVLTVGSLLLTMPDITSPLHAQTDTASKAPLSFHSLGNDQSIRFSVWTDKPQACFDVEVSTQPQPQAKIRLCISASMQIRKAEQVWGHPAGEQITRSLTSADLQTLENFLTASRARGELPPPALSGHPAMEFNLITNRMGKEGFIRPDIDKKEFYAPSEEAERDFIKNFIGFSESGSK